MRLQPRSWPTSPGCPFSKASTTTAHQSPVDRFDPSRLRHLLTHTAGFGYSIWNSDLRHYERATGLPNLFTQKNEALQLPLCFDPR